MSQEWYYSVDGDRQGPVAAAELKKLADGGTLKPTDLVWKDGMADWAPAKSIKGLFGAGPAGAGGAAAPSPSKSGEQAAARPRTDEAEADDRPSRRRPRDDEDEDDRPARRRRDDDEDRPSGRLRRPDPDEDDEDRPGRRRRDDDDELDEDEDRPRKKRRRVPEDVSNKKMVAGILAILLNSLGIHKFYLGMTGAGLTMLLVTVLTCGIGGMVMGVIGIIEGIIYLTKSDEEFYQTYIVEQKAWF